MGRKFEKGMMVMCFVVAVFLSICGFGLAGCYASWGFAHEAATGIALGIFGGLLFAIAVCAIIVPTSGQQARLLSTVCTVAGLLIILALVIHTLPLYELLGGCLTVLISPTMMVFAFSQRRIYLRQLQLDREYAETQLEQGMPQPEPQSALPEKPQLHRVK